MILLKVVIFLWLAYQYSATTAPTPSPTSLRSTMNSISTVAGTGTATSAGLGGKATSASMNWPRGIWEGTDGTFYVAQDNGNCIVKFTVGGNMFAQAGVCGTSGTSGVGGQATSALINRPFGMVVDTNGIFYFVELANHIVSAVATNGIKTTFVGTGTAGSTGDNGKATSATLNYPIGLWMTTSGVLYISNFNSFNVRSISTSNIITLFAGNRFYALLISS